MIIIITVNENNNLNNLLESIKSLSINVDDIRKNMIIYQPYLYYNFQSKRFSFQRDSFYDFIFCSLDVMQMLNKNTFNKYLLDQLEYFSSIYIESDVNDVINNRLPIDSVTCYELLVGLNESSYLNLVDIYIVKYLQSHITKKDLEMFIINNKYIRVNFIEKIISNLITTEDDYNFFINLTKKYSNTHYDLIDVINNLINN